MIGALARHLLPGVILGRNILQTAGIMHQREVTDAKAFGYYFVTFGPLGLLDPTNVADIPFWRSQGMSWKGAIGLTALRAMGGTAIIAYLWDPHHKREGGWDETGMPWDRAWQWTSKKKDEAKNFIEWYA